MVADGLTIGIDQVAALNSARPRETFANRRKDAYCAFENEKRSSRAIVMSTNHAKQDPLLYPDEATDHIRGPASAPVTVIEYGDFECPSCRQAHVALDIIRPHFGHRMRLVSSPLSCG